MLTGNAVAMGLGLGGVCFLRRLYRMVFALKDVGKLSMGSSDEFRWGGRIVAEGRADDCRSLRRATFCQAGSFLTRVWARCQLNIGLQKRLPAAFNLRLNIAYIPRIIQHEIGEPPFLLDRLLGGLAPDRIPPGVQPRAVARAKR